MALRPSIGQEGMLTLRPSAHTVSTIYAADISIRNPLELMSVSRIKQHIASPIFRRALLSTRVFTVPRPPPLSPPVYQCTRQFSYSRYLSRPSLVQGLTNAEHVRPPPERDGSHPHLFYHALTAPSALPSVFALSFLEKPLNPDVPRSRTILGWVGEHDEGAEAEGTAFQENSGFRQLLHEAIAEALTKPGFDEAIEAEALQRGDGWLHITDNRNVPALNRVGDPDDIIGSVMVENGKIVASTYQPMPTYRVCTSDGPTRLTDGLAKFVIQHLEKEWEREQTASL